MTHTGSSLAHSCRTRAVPCVRTGSAADNGWRLASDASGGVTRPFPHTTTHIPPLLSARHHAQQSHSARPFPVLFAHPPRYSAHLAPPPAILVRSRAGGLEARAVRGYESRTLVRMCGRAAGMGICRVAAAGTGAPAHSPLRPAHRLHGWIGVSMEGVCAFERDAPGCVCGVLLSGMRLPWGGATWTWTIQYTVLGPRAVPLIYMCVPSTAPAWTWWWVASRGPAVRRWRRISSCLTPHASRLPPPVSRLRSRSSLHNTPDAPRPLCAVCASISTAVDVTRHPLAQPFPSRIRCLFAVPSSRWGVLAREWGRGSAV
ncbi:hypothetical protein B0H11DRAFT_1199165 [Mycena galericulata]|nr:hypothetical protein B0H11DRAFT_1199165 [Mycena galericulata]